MVKPYLENETNAVEDVTEAVASYDLSAQNESLESFKLLIQDILDLTTLVQKKLAAKAAAPSLHEFKAEMACFKAYASVFITHHNTLFQIARNFAFDNEFINKQINEYVAMHFEYLTDCGWLINLDINSGDQTAGFLIFLSQSKKEFFKEGLTHKHALQNLLKFCDTITIKNNKAKTLSIEALVDAIKREDVDTINEILSTDMTLLSREYPIITNVNETGFTPLMMAAKYCKNVATFTQGIFLNLPTKKDKHQYISIRPHTDEKPFGSYTAFKIALHFGEMADAEYLYNCTNDKDIPQEIVTQRSTETTGSFYLKRNETYIVRANFFFTRTDPQNCKTTLIKRAKFVDIAQPEDNADTTRIYNPDHLAVIPDLLSPEPEQKKRRM